MAARYFVDEIPAEGPPRLPLETLHHLRHVVRSAVGDEILLFDGCGNEALTRISVLTRRGLELELLEIRQQEKPTRRRIEVCVSPPPENRFGQILEHGCELGLASIRPLVMEHSKESARKGERRDRWLRILRGAGGQCGSAWLPELHKREDFGDFLEQTLPKIEGLRVAAERAEAWPGEALSRAELESPKAVVLCVGPEGGFSQDERTRLAGLGFKAISIGQNTLRVETAVLAASTLLLESAGL